MRVANATATSSQSRDSNADRRGELDDRGGSAACAADELGREGVGGGGGGLDAAAGNARSGGGDRRSAEAEVGGNAVGRDCGRAEQNDGGGGAAAPADPPHRVRFMQLQKFLRSCDESDYSALTTCIPPFLDPLSRSPIPPLPVPAPRFPVSPFPRSHTHQRSLPLPIPSSYSPPTPPPSPTPPSPTPPSPHPHPPPPPPTPPSSAAVLVSVGPQPHISTSSRHSPPLPFPPCMVSFTCPPVLPSMSAWDRSQFAAHILPRFPLSSRLPPLS
ncbi:unnamed protein product [Closterium sp. NIES-54]